ncbi:MAG: NUDIX domain-containing protein [Candidatus Aenigmarchaeota archaeon]|nr:NUDIX domain-containing protein [Candidatus Aenigmarchaeota archaeon]
MEQVLVVNTEDLKSTIGNKTGLIEFDKKILDMIETKSYFVNRSEAETDETKKQIIPYCMVINNDKILAVKRKNPSELRLKDMLSIGIGGHINPVDQGTDTVSNAAMRELKEETDFSGNVVSQVVGFLSLSDTPVNRVHFGVVYRLEIDAEVKVIDEGLEGSFVPLTELPKLSDKMEGWSKVLAERVDMSTLGYAFKSSTKQTDGPTSYTFVAEDSKKP